MKKIEVIEFFAGIGSQKKSLDRQKIGNEVIAISEWDVNALISYDAIHTDDGIDYSKGLTKKEILEKLKNFTFSTDGKKPCNKERIKEKTLRQLYNANLRTKNMGDITKINKTPNANLWTYSFPCQDISLAGKQAGIKEGTRSGLLFEVERLLEICKANEELPEYLLLENVKNLVGKEFKSDFNIWLDKLEQLGYNNYWKIVNAKDCLIPQNRERVFCISIRKDINKEFDFPEKQELVLRLKDILEDEVDEKYYINKNWHFSTDLDEKHDTNEIAQIDNVNFKSLRTITDLNKICRCLDTMGGGQREPKIICEQRTDEGLRFFKDNIYGTIRTIDSGGDKRVIEIEESTIIAQRGRYNDDGEIEQQFEKRKDGLTNTIATVQKDNLILEKQEPKIITVGQVSNEGSQSGKVYSDGGIFPTVCACTHGYAIGNIETNYRIRKLTPKECWRLMGFDDEDIEKCIAKGISDSQLYKQAGNSIVVQCLDGIFENLFLK